MRDSLAERIIEAGLLEYEGEDKSLKEMRDIFRAAQQERDLEKANRITKELFAEALMEMNKSRWEREALQKGKE